ncbi:hypothetical protein LguiA_017849 [Lonicera macranthoides]
MGENSKYLSQIMGKVKVKVERERERRAAEQRGTCKPTAATERNQTNQFFIFS